MPRYETDGFGMRLAADDDIRSRKGRCSESVGDAYGVRFGNANQAHGPMLRNGFSPREPGGVQPGDVVQWMRFGTNPKSAGYRYGHLGIAARDVETGRMGYFSNFQGVRQWRPLDAGWRAFAPPHSTGTTQFDWQGPSRRGAGGPPALDLSLPGMMPPTEPLVPSEMQAGIDAATAGIVGRRLSDGAPALPGIPDLPSTGYARTPGVSPPEPLVAEQIGAWAQRAADENVLQPMRAIEAEIEQAPPRIEPDTSVQDFFVEPLERLVEQFRDSAKASFDANAAQIAETARAGAYTASLGPGGPALMDIATPAVHAVARLGLDLGWGMIREGVVKPALYAFGQTEGYGKAIAQQLDKARFFMGGPGDVPVYQDPDLLAKRPWLTETFGQTLGANLEDQTARSYHFEELLDEGSAVPESTTPSPVAAALTPWAAKPMAFAARVLTDPLTLANPGIGLESASIGVLERGFLREAMPVLKTALPGVAPGLLRKELQPLLRKMGMAGMRDALREGIEFTKPYAVKTARFLERQGMTPENASRVSAELMERFRAVRRAPANVFGYTLPQAAKVRDVVREAVGKTGLDYAPAFAMDAASRGRRATAKELLGMVTGTVPLVPFASEMDAYVAQELRRDARLLARGKARSPHVAAHFMGEAGGNQPFASRLAEQYAKADALRSQYEGRFGKQGHMLEDFLALLWPDAKFPRPYRDLLRQMHTESRAVNDRNLNQVRGIFEGLDDQEKKSLWHFSDRTIEREQALHDLLERTGELDDVLPFNIDKGSPDAFAYLKEKYVHWRSRPDPDGTRRNILKANSPALLPLAPRAAKINDVLEGPLRKYYGEMWRQEQAVAKRLRAAGIDVNLGQFKDYIPIRVQGEVMDWLAGNLTDMQMLHATTPAARQAFMRARVLPSAKDWIRQVVGAGGDSPTAAVIDDMEALTLIRTWEHQAFRQFDETLRFLKGHAIHLSDPKAKDLIRMGWQPLPRLFGKGQFSPLRQGFITEEIAQDTDQLARALSGTDRYEQLLARLETTAQELEAANQVIPDALHQQTQRTIRQLERARTKEQRLVQHLNSSGLKMHADTYDPDLIEWIVPPGVAAQWKPDAMSRAATTLQILNEKLGMNAFRGNLLVSPGFHVRNALDNWVGAPLLLGSSLLFHGDALQPIVHAVDAMKTMVGDVLQNWGALPETAAKARLERFENGWFKKVLRGIPEDRQAMYTRELVREGIDVQGVMRHTGQVATGSKLRRALAAPRDFNRRLGQTFEAIPRVATYIAAREKGYSGPEAKRLADRAFVNYAHEIKAPIDDLLNQVFLFWPYTRKRAEQTVMAIFRNPAKGAVMGHLRDVAAGGPTTTAIKVPGLPQQDIPLGFDVGGGASFSPRDKYLQDHGLRGRYDYVSRDFVPLALPPRKADGTWDTDPVRAFILDQVYATPKMTAIKGRHMLFVRHALGPLEVLGRLQQAIGYGDASEVGSWLTPPLQIAKEYIFPETSYRRNADGTMQGAHQRIATPMIRTLVAGGIPGGVAVQGFARLAAENLGKDRRVRTRDDLYRRESRERSARASVFSAAGLTFTVVPWKSMYNEMSDAEKKHWRQLSGDVEEDEIGETMGKAFVDKLRRGAAGAGRHLRGQPSP